MEFIENQPVVEILRCLWLFQGETVKRQNGGGQMLYYSGNAGFYN